MNWLQKLRDQILDLVLKALLPGLTGLALWAWLKERIASPVPLWASMLTFAGGAAIGYGLSAWRHRRRPTHPTDALRLFERQELKPSTWSYSYKDHRDAREGKPMSAMLNFSAAVTNIIHAPVRIVEGRVTLGWLRRKSTYGMSLTRAKDSNLFRSEHYITPGDTTEFSSIFIVTPPPRGAKPGKTISGRVELRDQWGNSYRTGKVTFTPPAVPPAAKAGLHAEAIHSLQDPIAKDVAAILKAEIGRYNDAGRRSHGLLGSVKSRLQAGGREGPGIGADWRKTDTADQQDLVHGIDLPAITSDNVDALVALYGRQVTEGLRVFEWVKTT